MRRIACLATILTSLIGAPALLADEGTRLLRMPDVSEREVAFVYANDVWMAAREGGDARRLTTFEGAETHPHFSPDGSMIAFSGEYDGNTDVYVVPVEGGSPRRLTWHPGADLVRGWTPSGDAVLFASGRINAPVPIPRFWTISLEGGLPQALPIPRIDEGAYSPSGDRLAYQKITQWESEFRNYRGGQANPIRVIELESLEVTKLPWDPDERSNDIDPVWVGERVLFLSDRDHAHNVWSYDLTSGELVQRTFFRDFDVKSLEGGPGVVIFEKGGFLYTLDAEEGEPRRLAINVRGDFPWARPRWEEVGGAIVNAALSPTGKRALFEARGEIFTLPAEKGDVRNLSRASGSAERAPAWSPKGDRVAWFSDASGEYALVIADQFGEQQKKIEIPGATFFYDTRWSPKGERIAFTDADRVLFVVEVESGELRRVDDEGFAHPERIIAPLWSPDGRYIAYVKRLRSQYPAIFVHDVESGESRQLTDGMSASLEPAWDASGKYLWFKASTDYGPNVGWLDMSSLPFETNYALYLAVLAKDTEHPFAPESDEEEVVEEKESDAEEKKSEKGKKSEDESEGEKDEGVEVRIDFEGLHQRIVALDLPARPYRQLAAGPEGVLFFGEPIPNEPGMTLKSFSIEERKAEDFMGPLMGYALSHDRKKLLYAAPGNRFGIVDAKGKAKVGDGAIDTGAMRARIDPPAEWRQIFREALRFQRDYFYVENVHGLDLAWAEEAYGAWLPHVRHRSDLTYILDILGGETAIGHSFTGGGDTPEVERVPIGLLGADLELHEGRYRIARIYDGEDWNPGLEAPLAGPGLEVSEGDYLLAVEGVELKAGMNPYALFDRRAGKQTRLMLASEPGAELGSEAVRVETVVPVANETALRTWAWVEERRQMVDELSGGKLAYVWIPNTGFGGYTFFNRMFFAQQEREGAVLDERFNQGGLIADYIVDVAARELLGYFNNPLGDKQPWTAPNAALWGPKVMIINDAAGSGGDMLPYMFRKKGVGPLVGTRTWGGLVGIWDVPQLVDGGYITAPRGGFYNTEGEWEVENEGVPPDVVVENEPRAVMAGGDPQLERAVELALERLESEGVELLEQPADPVRAKRPE